MKVDGRKRDRSINIAGEVFGMLTALERVGTEPTHRQALWRCRCECGGEAVIPAPRLRRGGARSCGCVGRAKASESLKGRLIDIVGQRFGRLTVIERGPHSGALTTWRCKCDCGNEKLAPTGNLKGGQIISCGCRKSEIGAEHIKLAQAAEMERREYNAAMRREEREAAAFEAHEEWDT